MRFVPLILIVFLFISCDESSDVYFNKSIELENQGKIQEAKLMLEKAIELDPQNFLATLNLGSLLSREGSYKEAIEKYEQAIQIDSFIIAPYLNIGRNLGRMGKSEESKLMFEKCIVKYKEFHYLFSKHKEFALKLNPSYEELVYALGISYMQLNQFDIALEKFDFLLGRGVMLEYMDCNICYSEMKLGADSYRCEFCLSCPDSQIETMEEEVRFSISEKCGSK